MLKIVGDDMWDPNNWVEDDHEHRIYADETLEIYAVVDAIDYPYLSQFKWSVHDRKKAARGHIYLKRNSCEFLEKDGEPYESRITGTMVRNRKRIVRTVFLHQDIMRRMKKRKPTKLHKEVDHRNRRMLDCRRKNLRWATRKQQVINSSKSRAGNGRFKRDAKSAQYV